METRAMAELARQSEDIQNLNNQGSEYYGGSK